MKIKIIYLIAFLLFILNVKAQYPCINGISTNPLNPINTQLPSKKNTFFNWQDSIYQVQPISSNCVRGSQIESPFYKIDNLEGLRESKDMQWEDGWELLRRGFGLNDLNVYTTDPVPNAYLVLYNKYTGIMRVLLKVCRGADYNAAKITLTFNSLSQVKTDLLEISRGAVSALDKRFFATGFAAGSKYLNDNTKWFYADFPMMYDPCTCNYKSKLNILSELVSTSQISLEGGITGDIYSKNVGGKAQIQKDGSFGWKDFADIVNGKASTAYSSINGFVTSTQAFANTLGANASQTASINLFGNALKDNKFLKIGLNAFPWLKSAVGLLDIFIGGGKTTVGSQEVKLLPLSVNLTMKLDGTMTTVNPYHNIIFTNPGSKDAQLDPDVYPYYNEVMGVFNLIKTPSIFIGKENTNIVCCDIRRCYQGKFNTKTTLRLSLNSLIYSLNPAADLTIQNMKAAVVVSAVAGNSDTLNLSTKFINEDFKFYEGKDLTVSNGSKYKFRTDYFDLKPLSDKKFSYIDKSNLCAVFFNNSGLGSALMTIDTSKIFLKLMINLKRNNASANTQNILVVLTYPLKAVVDNGAVNLPVNYSVNDSSIVTEAPSSYVNSFCNSTVYNNIDRQSRLYIDSVESIKKLNKDGIVIYPNPTSGLINIKIKQQESNLISLQVLNVQGKTVLKTKENNFNLNEGMVKQINSNLESGTYFLNAITSKGLLTTKFIVIK